jgi:hypothetical protein
MESRCFIDEGRVLLQMKRRFKWLLKIPVRHGTQDH